MISSIRHIPHSSTEIPAQYREPFLLSDDGLARELLRMTDSFHTPEWLLEAAREGFSRVGFSVEIDTPLSGALTPAKHYRSGKSVHALMIEVRRDLYMDKETGDRSGQLGEVRNAIQKIIERLEKTLEARRATSPTPGKIHPPRPSNSSAPKDQP